VHAFITPTPELALQMADAADQRRQAWKREASPSQPLPGLLGLPLAIKDVLALKGVRCTGLAHPGKFRPTLHGTAASSDCSTPGGGDGKTTWMSSPWALPPRIPVTAPPTTPGPDPCARRSSGAAPRRCRAHGSAALGSDTGGSVRRRFFLRVTGIKPTYGRVSRYGLVAFGSSARHGRRTGDSAEDAALIFTHLAGYDLRDATRWTCRCRHHF